jgi:hypothetical protein
VFLKKMILLAYPCVNHYSGILFQLGDIEAKFGQEAGSGRRTSPMGNEKVELREVYTVIFPLKYWICLIYFPNWPD